MASAAFAFVACLAVLAAAPASAEQLPKPQTPISQNDNLYYLAQNTSNTPLAGPPRFIYGTEDLPENDSRFAPPGNAGTPDQVKLTTVSPTEVWVTFTTGSAKNGTYTTAPPAGPALPFGKQSVVSYGTSSGRLSKSIKAGLPHTYTQTADNSTKINGTTVVFNKVYYISPFLHLAKLKGLKPATRYYYSIKNPANPDAPATKVFSFKTQPKVGDDSPIKIAVIGDIGETYNTSDTLNHVAGNKPDIVYNMGDFSYADHYLNNNPVKWDLWARLVSPVFSTAPHNPTNGNHEIENSNGNNQGVTQQSYNNRYPMPYMESGSDSNLYYSIEHGSVHVVFLSQYTDYARTSAQYAWAQADIASIDRSKTPWVFVIFHGPVYHTYTVHYKQYDCWRQVWEPLFNQAGVDLVMSGHVHAYERSNPVNNYTVDDAGCAPTYITIGDGGNSEQLYHQYVDTFTNDPNTNGSCPTPVDNDLSSDPITCVSPKTQVPYCTPTQPAWSAYREDAFGHAILEIQDSTHAKWSWYRNLDNLPVVTDSMVLQRDTRACPNRRQGAVLAPLPKRPHKTPHHHFNNHEYQHKRYVKFGGKLYEWKHDEYVPCENGEHP